MPFENLNTGIGYVTSIPMSMALGIPSQTCHATAGSLIFPQVHRLTEQSSNPLRDSMGQLKKARATPATGGEQGEQPTMLWRTGNDM